MLKFVKNFKKSNANVNNENAEDFKAKTEIKNESAPSQAEAKGGMRDEELKVRDDEDLKEPQRKDEVILKPNSVDLIILELAPVVDVKRPVQTPTNLIGLLNRHRREVLNSRRTLLVLCIVFILVAFALICMLIVFVVKYTSEPLSNAKPGNDTLFLPPPPPLDVFRFNHARCDSVGRCVTDEDGDEYYSVVAQGVCTCHRRRLKPCVVNNTCSAMSCSSNSIG